MKKKLFFLFMSNFYFLDASQCTASNNPLQEEKSTSNHITDQFSREDLPRLYRQGLGVILNEELKKKSSTDPSMNQYKMSSYPPVPGEAGYVFNEYYMLGDGSCAKYSMGTTPQKAQRLLLSKGIAKPDPVPHDKLGHPIVLSELERQERQLAFEQRQEEAIRIRTYAHLEIVDVFIYARQQLPEMIRNSQRYKQLERDLKDKSQTVQEHLIKLWAKEEDTFKDYVRHGFGAGVFTRFEQHFEGEEVRPYMINALAYAMGINLNIWYQVIDEENVQDRPDAHLPQGKFVRVHNFTVNHAWPTAHLAHRGAQFIEGMPAVDARDHYNRLVSVDDHTGIEKALRDENRYLSTLLRDRWNQELLDYYRRGAFNILYALGGLCQLPLEIKKQTNDYCEGLVGAYKNIDKNPLSEREVSLVCVLMARAYALAARQLEKKGVLSASENTQLQKYREKRESMRRVGLDLDSFTEEELALRLTYLYQGSFFESEFYRNYPGKDTVERRVALEFNDVLKILYEHQKKAILDCELLCREGHDLVEGRNSFFKGLLTTPHFFPEDPMPQDFDVEDYLRLYPDVESYAEKEGLDRIVFGYNHYKNTGRNEGRIYQIIPKDFKAHEYLALWQDIVNYQIEQGASLKNSLDFGCGHYKSHGCLKENRSYKLVPLNVKQNKEQEPVLPEDFSPMKYIALHPDILAHFLERDYSLEKALEYATTHYVCTGIGEDRIYK